MVQCFGLGGNIRIRVCSLFVQNDRPMHRHSTGNWFDGLCLRFRGRIQSQPAQVQNKYQIWKLNSLQSPYYSIQNVNNNYYLSTIVFTTHQTFEQVNGVNALWLTSWGYRVGWTSSTLGEANKRANDIIPRQSWRFIPVSTSDNMSMVN